MLLKHLNLLQSSEKFCFGQNNRCYISKLVHLCKEQGEGIRVGNETKIIEKISDLAKIGDEAIKLKLDSLEQAISYKLYTRKLKVPLVLTYDNWNTAKENFNFDKEVKLITHGWLSSGESEFAESIKDAYLVKDDLNVIIVDWSTVASNASYILPMVFTKSIGEHYAKFLNYLIDNGVHLNKVHLIGHSLGAHISGFCGRKIFTGKATRLTALDPAMPGFPPELAPADHVTNTDAHFVDVIHTCGGALGILYPIGHVDFYPNSGVPPQPGCLQSEKVSLACSHSRSWMYFAESINANHKFFAKKCKSWLHYMKNSYEEAQVTLMGDPCPRTATGNYFLKTNPVSPFAMGK